MSSFGQTFLISLFVPYFLNDFSLSNATFGSMYSAATLISAGTLPYVGKWIDYIPLRSYSLAVAGGLLVASLTLALSWHISLLFVGIVLLRISGQGLSSHTARTTMARYFEHRRGKALSIASLGYPLGEGVLPAALTALLGVISWHLTWGLIVAFIGLVFVPLIWLLLNKREHTLVEDEDKASGKTESSWPVYRMLLSDYRLWLITPAVLLPPFWITGLFLYQVSVAEQLGWSAALIATAFAGFAVGRVSSSLSSGPAIDRFSARAIFPFYLLPFGAGLVFAFYHPGNWSAFAYMTFVGITLGIGGNIKSALWAELYGTEYLGTIRSLFSSLMVFSTAMSPFLMGWAIDHDVSMESIILAAIATVVVATLLTFVAFWGKPDSKRVEKEI